MAPAPSTSRRNGNLLREVPIAESEYDRGCRDRFLTIWRNLIGEVVTVHLCDGSIHEGVYFTCNPFPGEEFHIVLRMSSNSGATLCIPVADIVHLHASSFPVNKKKNSTNFATDKDISGGSRVGRERELQIVDSTWVTENHEMKKSDETFGNELSRNNDGNSSPERWDQFEVNHRLFNVSSTFDENLYTTQLDRSKLTPAMQRDAERMALEIEGKLSTNSHLREERNQQNEMDGDDEEAKFSSVLGTGKFIVGGVGAYRPPAVRQREAAKEELHKMLNLGPKFDDQTIATVPETKPDISVKSKTWANIAKGGSTNESESTLKSKIEVKPGNKTVVDIPQGIIALDSVEKDLMNNAVPTVKSLTEPKFKFNPNAKVFKPFVPNVPNSASQPSSTASPSGSDAKSMVMDGNGPYGNDMHMHNMQASQQVMHSNMIPMPMHALPMNGYPPQQPVFYGSNPVGMISGMPMHMEGHMIPEHMHQAHMIPHMIPIEFQQPGLYPGMPVNPYMNFHYPQHPGVYPQQMVNAAPQNNTFHNGQMQRTHFNNMNGRSRSNSFQSQKSSVMANEEGGSPLKMEAIQEPEPANNIVPKSENAPGEGKNMGVVPRGKGGRRAANKGSKYGGGE